MADASMEGIDLYADVDDFVRVSRFVDYRYSFTNTHIIWAQNAL